MTLDEFKSEMEALMQKVDDRLAEEIARASGDPSERFGAAWEVQQLFPRDRSTFPSQGGCLRVSIAAQYQFVRYRYESAQGTPAGVPNA